MESFEEFKKQNEEDRKLFKEKLYGIALGYEYAANILRNEAVKKFLADDELKAQILKEYSSQLQRWADSQRKEADSYIISAE